MTWCGKKTESFKFGPGVLGAYTLGDLIDGNVPGYTYIGWDWGPIVIGVKAQMRTAPDHYEVTANTDESLTCVQTTFTVKACANSSCSVGYQGGVAGSLSLNGAGATVNYPAGAAFNIPSGSSSTSIAAQVTTVPMVGYVSVGLSGLSVAATSSSSVYCGLGAAATSGGTCNFKVKAAGLMMSLAPHVADTEQSLNIQAVRASDNGAACLPAFANVTKAIQVRCSYADPVSGSLSPRVDGNALNAAGQATAACDASGRTMNLNFDGTGQAQTSFQYADVGRIRLDASYLGSGIDTGLNMSGTVSVVTAPLKFLFIALPSAAVKAGADFGVTVKAVNQSQVVTPNFGQESSPQIPTLTFTKVSPTGTGASDGVFSGSLGNFENGMAKPSNLKWSEVGSGDLQVTLADYLASNQSVSGTTGTSGAVGPFMPHHFNVAVVPSCGSFTYRGQPFTTRVTAVNQSGGTTVNYDGTSATTPNWAKATDVVAVNGGTATVSNGSFAASAFAAGLAQKTTMALNVANKLTAPQTVGFRAAEVLGSDGVTSAGFTEGSMLFRSGRLKVSNVYGSEKVALNAPVAVQYWSGSAWVRNHLDTCTTAIPAAAMAFSNYLDSKGQSTSGWYTSVLASSISAGFGSVQLSPPTGGGAGSVDVAVNLGGTATDRSCLSNHPPSTGANMPWLRSQNGAGNGCASTWDRDPSWRASFGVFAPETKKMIYRGEMH